MSQSGAQNGPVVVPRDAYPTVRVTSEFYLRSVDLLTQIQGGELISSLVFAAVWHNSLQGPAGGAVGVRELARRLNLPYETVRRHAMGLVRAGQCTATPEGIAIVPAVLKSRVIAEVMRKTYLNTERMLIDLTRAGLAKYKPPAAATARRGGLTRDQMVIAIASTRQLLAAIRLAGDTWNGDVLRGLVFTAIWTANVKHITNTAPASIQTVLPDDQRLPVSVLAIANSLRLPYETVRRHALALEKAGVCRRVGRKGLVVPASEHLKLASGTAEAHRIVAALFAELRREGIEV
jgi:DNA-binding transcriptional regulator YhcF (GntR family)